MRSLNKLAAFGFMLLASSGALAVEDSAFDAVTDDTAAAAATLAEPLAPVSIDVLTELKVPTTTVKASKPSVPSIEGYWVMFSGPTWTKAVVTIQVTATGELEKRVTLVYLKPSGATGTFYAPFSISDWTGSTSGKGTATVTFWNGTTLLAGGNHAFTLLHN